MLNAKTKGTARCLLGRTQGWAFNSIFQSRNLLAAHQQGSHAAEQLKLGIGLGIR